MNSEEQFIGVSDGKAPCVVKSVNGAKGNQVFLPPDKHLLRELAGSLRQDTPFLQLVWRWRS